MNENLQKRYNNPLFKVERQKVTPDELQKAKKKDVLESIEFKKEVDEFYKKYDRNDYHINDSRLIEKIQYLIEKAAYIGGSALKLQKKLEQDEQKVMSLMIEDLPRGKDLLMEAYNLSVIARLPYMAQSKRITAKYSKNEEIAMLLSEDSETISIIGYASRSFPNYKPSTADIITHLANAQKRGLSKAKSDNIMNAWYEIK